MEDFEKLGQFYLGRQHDLPTGRLTENLVMYDSKDLVTHGVCVGMTGSGKTGLCLALLEEAAIDSIPALVIDPKGDMANLLLTFPESERGGIPSLDQRRRRREGEPVRRTVCRRTGGSLEEGPGTMGTGWAAHPETARIR